MELPKEVNSCMIMTHKDICYGDVMANRERIEKGLIDAIQQHGCNYFIASLVHPGDVGVLKILVELKRTFPTIQVMAISNQKHPMKGVSIEASAAVLTGLDLLWNLYESNDVLYSNLESYGDHCICIGYPPGPLPFRKVSVLIRLEAI